MQNLKTKNYDQGKNPKGGPSVKTETVKTVKTAIKLDKSGPGKHVSSSGAQNFKSNFNQGIEKATPEEKCSQKCKNSTTDMEIDGTKNFKGKLNDVNEAMQTKLMNEKMNAIDSSIPESQNAQNINHIDEIAPTGKYAIVHGLEHKEKFFEKYQAAGKVQLENHTGTKEKKFDKGSMSDLHKVVALTKLRDDTNRVNEGIKKEAVAALKGSVIKVRTSADVEEIKREIWQYHLRNGHPNMGICRAELGYPVGKPGEDPSCV